MAFCGFAVHAAKSDYNLRGLRPPNPPGPPNAAAPPAGKKIPALAWAGNLKERAE